MSKRTVFTTVTPLPLGVSRQTVMETLHNHIEMIDLNPSHESREPIKSPPEATPEEYHCTWYQITDKISYMPGYKGKVSFKACFHDLVDGLQTHVYAPMGLDIKEKWTIGGSLPGEPHQPVEIGKGLPVSGLYLREDVEMHCNFLMTRFVRKTLEKSLSTLVARLVVKSQLAEAENNNRRMTYNPSYQSFTPPQSPPMSPPLMQAYPGQGHQGMGMQTQMGFPPQGMMPSPRMPYQQPYEMPHYQQQYAPHPNAMELGDGKATDVGPGTPGPKPAAYQVASARTGFGPVELE